MKDRPLRYSERQRLAETGSLGDLTDDAATALRNAIWLYLQHRRNAARLDLRTQFDQATSDALGRHFGNADVQAALARPSVEDFLDAIEILLEEGQRQREYSYTASGRRQGARGSLTPSGESDLNAMFDRHRFAYRLERGEVRRISSPLLDTEIVGPTLLTAARPGWEEVERSFKEALSHQRRADEWRESLTASAAAVEAAFKASGYKGATLGDLARDFRRSPVATGYSPKIAENLSDLLEQLMAWRSHTGSAHGKAPGAESPPPELVALAVHWAGAFIAYLGSV